MQATIAPLKYLGFYCHEIFKPKQQNEFLGFIIDSAKMTVTMSKDKMIAITNKTITLMTATLPTIRQLASIIYSVITLFLAVHLGKLHYKALDKDKTVVYKETSGNFSKTVSNNISVKAIDELNWWLTEISHARRHIHLPDTDFTIHTDASDTGWWATDDNNTKGGKWLEEKGYYINYLIIWNSKQFNNGGSVSEKCKMSCKNIFQTFAFEKTYEYQLFTFLEIRTL